MPTFCKTIFRKILIGKVQSILVQKCLSPVRGEDGGGGGVEQKKGCTYHKKQMCVFVDEFYLFKLFQYLSC